MSRQQQQEMHWAAGAEEGAHHHRNDLGDCAYADVDAVTVERQHHYGGGGAEVAYHHYSGGGNVRDVPVRAQCVRAGLALLAVVMTALAIAGQLVPFCQYTTKKSRYTFGVWQWVRSYKRKVKTRHYRRKDNEGEKAFAILTAALSFVSAVLAIVYASWSGCGRRAPATHGGKHVSHDARAGDAPAAAVEAMVRREEAHVRRHERARKDRDIGIATFSMFIAAAFCGLVTVALTAHFYVREVLHEVEDEDDEFARLGAGFALFVAVTAIGLVAFLLLAIPCVAGLQLCGTPSAPAPHGRYVSSGAAARYVEGTEHAMRDEHVRYDHHVAMRTVATPPLPMPMQPPARTPAHARSPGPAYATTATGAAAETAPPRSSHASTPVVVPRWAEDGSAEYGAYEYTHRSAADVTRHAADAGLEVRQPGTAVYMQSGRAAPAPAAAVAHGTVLPATTMAAFPLTYHGDGVSDRTAKDGDVARAAPWPAAAAAPPTAIAKSHDDSASSKAAEALPPPLYHSPTGGKSVE